MSKGVAVVIGVGPGLGAAIVRKFAKEGYAVAQLSRRLEPLLEFEKEITASGGKVLSIAANAGDPADIAKAFKEIRQKLGDPDTLIYNAGPGGISWPPPGILGTSPEAFSKALAAGAVGALAAAQEVLPKFIENKKGTIILTGATASLRGGKGFLLLAGPKFALRALGQSLAREFQPQGVHVAHVIIDGQIDLGAATRQRSPDRPIDSFLNPDAIADTYWHLHTQDKTAWTHELEVRPFVEKF